MTIVKNFNCPYCGHNEWHLSKNRHGVEVWFQFQCSSCGGTNCCVYYGHEVDAVEKLIDMEERERTQ